LENRWWGGGKKFAYWWSLRIALPHLVSVLSENKVSPAERVLLLLPWWSEIDTGRRAKAAKMPSKL